MNKPHYIWSYVYNKPLLHDTGRIRYMINEGAKVSAKSRSIAHGEFYGPSKVSSPEFKRAQTAKNRAARNLVENMDRSANTERIVWNTKYPELDAFVNGNTTPKP